MAGAKWQHSAAKGKVGIVTVMTTESKQRLEQYDSYRPTVLANHGIARSETDRKLTNFLLDLNKQKSLGQKNKILSQIIKRESWPLNQFQDLSQFSDSESHE